MKTSSKRPVLIMSVLFGLFIAGILYHRYYFSTRVYIDPVDFAQFNRAVPVSSELCGQEDSIKYYYYDDIPEDKRTNNKFGLYIYAENENFIEWADKLVNSNGGDWGYALIPYNVQDKDKDKWARVFYLLNRNRLIPIIQLWNVDPDDYEKQTRNAAKFLNSFIWPVRQRYVSVYNEPNSAAFWYGRVDPGEYARILNFTVDEFKKINSSFFMLNGAFNTSAPTDSQHMDAEQYMSVMNEEAPGIFGKLDGWASHSYPQPNFSGSPYDTGRWSIRAYEKELEFLETAFGVTNLPVFITETGWAHAEGKNTNTSFVSQERAAEHFKIAYEEIWLPDDRVRAVTPFSIWYEAPYDHFAWLDEDGRPYRQYEVIQGMNKLAGTPEQLFTSSTSSLGCPER